MKSLPSNKIMMKKYNLTEKELFKIMNDCIRFFLSEDELENFIYEYYMKKEENLNLKYQNFLIGTNKNYVTTKK